MALRCWSVKPSVMAAGVIACAFASTPPMFADEVQLRSGLPGIEGKITRIDDAGVTIETTHERSEFVRWDFVRDVGMKHPDPNLAKYLEDAAMLWRARTRLERRDAALAEPLFERQFEKYRGQTSETALLVAEGLLRCRLAREAHESAVIPALETARLRRAVKTAANVFRLLPPVIDEQTSLCPELPPVWVMSSGVVKLERDLKSYNAGADTVIAGLAEQYLRAVQQQLELRQSGDERTLAADHPGVTLLRTMVDLTCSDPAKRAAALQGIGRNPAESPAWTQAWTYYFTGVSLLMESGAGRNEEGLIDLAYLPARFEADQPYLAGLALAKLADACDAWGNSAAASSLRNELTTRFPNHPVLAAQRRTATTQPARSTTSTTEPARESS